MQVSSNSRGDPLPQSLNVLMKFFVGICTTIMLVINLPTKSPIEMLRQ